MEKLSNATRLWYQKIQKRTAAAMQSHVKALLLEESGQVWDQTHDLSRARSVNIGGIYYVFQPSVLCYTEQVRS